MRGGRKRKQRRWRERGKGERRNQKKKKAEGRETKGDDVQGHLGVAPVGWVIAHQTSLLSLSSNQRSCKAAFGDNRMGCNIANPRVLQGAWIYRDLEMWETVEEVDNLDNLDNPIIEGHPYLIQGSPGSKLHLRDLCVQEVFRGVSLGKAYGGSRTEHIQCGFSKGLSLSLGELWGWGEARVPDLCISLDQSFNSSFCLEGSMTWHGVGGSGLVGLFIWGQFLEVVHSQCANQLGIPAFIWKQGR